MKKYLAPAGAAIAALGIVGGVAATQAFQPVAHPKTQVQLVQPAAQTVTVTPSPTTTTATVAPKPVVKATTAKPAPVQSTQAVAPAPRIVQKAAVVSSDTSTSTSSAPAPDPTPVTTTSPAAPVKPEKGNPVGTVTYDPYASSTRH